MSDVIMSCDTDIIKPGDKAEVKNSNLMQLRYGTNSVF